MSINKFLMSFIVGSLVIAGCSNSSKKSTSPGSVTSEMPNFTDDYTDLFEGDWNMPGLYNKDGSARVAPAALDETKLGTLDVVAMFGARANDENYDNSLAFENATNMAETLGGAIINVPAGTYYFKGELANGGQTCHITLPSNTVLQGAGMDQTFLVSNFRAKTNEGSETTVINITNSQNVIVRNLTVSSNTADNLLPDVTVDNPQQVHNLVYSAPKYGITAMTSSTAQAVEEQAQNILISNVRAEKFLRMGIRLFKTINAVVDECLFEKAVNLAAGGMGYGVNIQSQGVGVNLVDKLGDSYHNIVTNSEFRGPYIRHGVVVQYHSHNNLIKDNVFTDNILDAIDLHGENEFSNEVVGNLVENTWRGAGIGVGNSGASHAGSGRNNYIHDNEVVGGKEGISIAYGTHFTIVDNNKFADVAEHAVRCDNANYSYIINNEISNVGEDAFNIKYYFVWDNPALGIPDNYIITGNTIDGAKRALYVRVTGENFVFERNTITNVETEIVNESDSFVLPEKLDYFNPIEGVELAPTDSNYVESGAGDAVQTQTNMKFKASVLEPGNNRVAFAKFDLTGMTYTKAYLKLGAWAKDEPGTINIWSNTTYTDWKANEISWNNTPLHDENLGIAKNTEEHPLTKFYDLRLPFASNSNFYDYYLDVTDSLQAIEASIFTLLFSNDAVEEVYMEIASGLRTVNAMRLIFVNE